jgi:hypothetical protein
MAAIENRCAPMDTIVVETINAALKKSVIAWRLA